ncbi:MAG TPA: hypothetical protein VM010_07610 [Chitinophagaceae bacterium]|nr:hypothetical protein [Chitinophagaceae bacterium]
MKAKEPNQTRGTIVFVFIVLLGYLLGALIKHVNIGLILGLGMGLLASGIVRNR